MKTVFILGAGASKAAGAPDMNSFLETARLLVERQEIKSQDEVDAIQDVLYTRADLRQVISDKSTLPLDIEGLYGAIEIAQIIERFPNRDKVQKPPPLCKTGNEGDLLVRITRREYLRKTRC